MKKTLMLFALACAGTSLADTWTDSSTGITWTYTVAGGKASLGGGSWDSPAVPTSTKGALTIPSKLNGYAVTSIGEGAFEYCSGLTSATAIRTARKSVEPTRIREAIATALERQLIEPGEASELKREIES